MAESKHIEAPRDLVGFHSCLGDFKFSFEWIMLELCMGTVGCPKIREIITQGVSSLVHSGVKGKVEATRNQDGLGPHSDSKINN